MLKLGKFTVKWQHLNPTQDRVMTDKFGRKYYRRITSKEFFGTICTIKTTERLESSLLPVGEAGELCFSGTAKLHGKNVEIYDEKLKKFKIIFEHDEFSKEIGRKLSLADALSKLNLTKEEKQAVWDDYHNRK